MSNVCDCGGGVFWFAFFFFFWQLLPLLLQSMKQTDLDTQDGPSFQQLTCWLFIL